MAVFFLCIIVCCEREDVPPQEACSITKALISSYSACLTEILAVEEERLGVALNRQYNHAV